MQDFIRAEPLAFCHSEGATATEESRSGQEVKGSPPLLAFALTEPTFGKKAAGVKMTKNGAFTYSRTACSYVTSFSTVCFSLLANIFSLARFALFLFCCLILSIRFFSSATNPFFERST